MIGQLLDSIRAQDYPADLFDIYVVADNCTDATAEVCRARGAFVHERQDKVKVGKGYALNWLLERIPVKKYDGFLVFDADNLLRPDYLTEMNKTFSAGYSIVTSYRNTKNYGDNWISAGYGLWFLREARYLNGARMALGSSCAVSGTELPVLAAGTARVRRLELLPADGGYPVHHRPCDIRRNHRLLPPCRVL